MFCMELWQHEDFKIMNRMIFHFSSEESCTGDFFDKKNMSYLTYFNMNW